MSPRWEAEEPVWGPISPLGWGLVIGRGLVLGLVTYGCLVLLLLARLIEAPLFGPGRPVTPRITQFVCRTAFVVLGMRFRVRGEPMRGVGAVVANHASWLDIFALNAPQRIYFVAKADVAGWAGIGWLARATGTLFIRRDSKEAVAQKAVFEARLAAGHRLLFFPEGTSTDGLQVLAFKPTLFEAFFAPGLQGMRVQPVSVIYHAPPGGDARFYGWWGGMSFGGHLLQVLAQARQGGVEVVFHPPLAVADFAGRKALAGACEAAVRAGMERAGAQPGG